jgi:chemotaxis protein methyltransferase CheR
MTLITHDFQITDADFETVRDVVYKHCGITLSDEKKALVRARIAKQMRVGGFPTAAKYLEKVLADRDGTMFAEFINAISTNLTSFFRESEHFSFLSNTVLPALFSEKKRKGDNRVLLWSAACSSGEEPYTLGMTILNAIDRLGVGSTRWDIRILATDISTRMLDTARTGIYDESRLEKVPPEYRPRFFTAAPQRGTEKEYSVTQELRAMVRFRHLNLIDNWPFKGPFDFIFCRNVMIYFDKETQQSLVEKFWNCIVPGGYLFTGHSESLTGIAHLFRNRKPSIYQKQLEGQPLS